MCEQGAVYFILLRDDAGKRKPYFGVLTVPRAAPRCCVCLRREVQFTMYRSGNNFAYAPKLYRGTSLASARSHHTQQQSYLEEEERAI